LIFPISALLVRAVFRRKPPSRTNPGGITVMETVVPMIAGLLAAWLIMPHRIEFVFPLCAIAVGTHYFGFQTAYGDKTYWTLGAVMCFAGVAAILSRVPGPGCRCFPLRDRSHRTALRVLADRKGVGAASGQRHIAGRRPARRMTGVGLHPFGRPLRTSCVKQCSRRCCLRLFLS
jgi:hypothetical protein